MEQAAISDVFVARLIRNCAPTLVGIKPASLFSCCERKCDHGSSTNDCSTTNDWRAKMHHEIKRCSDILAHRGIEIVVLSELRGGPLVYVFNPTDLAAYLRLPETSRFLQEIGYPSDPASNLGACLEILSGRLSMSIGTSRCDFPHEIGLFLGYPYADVRGFIDNRGANYRMLGCWKVYSDVDAARAKFEAYRECTRVCEWLHEMGVGIDCMATHPEITESPRLSGMKDRAARLIEYDGTDMNGESRWAS